MEGRLKVIDRTEPWRKKLVECALKGTSAPLADLLRMVAAIAPLDVPVLILGESGTGKTEIAELMHKNSRRRRAPFVELNCAAIPETLVESELFGASKGAHSTATEATLGKIGAGEGGTLLLDEVSELPLSAQAKLLTFLQSKRYYALGSTRPQTADVRVIAVTNGDLPSLVASKRFREDLYYRLKVVTVAVPSLAERGEDVPALAQHFVEAAAHAYGIEPRAIAATARLMLTMDDWPGNVRELRHRIESGLVMAAAEGAPRIEAQHLYPAASSAIVRPLSLRAATRRFQRALLEDTLSATHWNVREAARALQITRSHIYNLLRDHGLARPESETADEDAAEYEMQR
jgi:Nif-specific regulatory protein